MNIAEEVKEFRSYVKELIVEDDNLKLSTLEDIYFEIKVNTQGYYIIHCSSEIQQRNFDDLGQILTTYSPLYRNKFANDLFTRLSELNTS